MEKNDDNSSTTTVIIPIYTYDYDCVNIFGSTKMTNYKLKFPNDKDNLNSTNASSSISFDENVIELTMSNETDIFDKEKSSNLFKQNRQHFNKQPKSNIIENYQLNSRYNDSGKTDIVDFSLHEVDGNNNKIYGFTMKKKL